LIADNFADYAQWLESPGVFSSEQFRSEQPDSQRRHHQGGTVLTVVLKGTGAAAAPRHKPVLLHG